MTANHISMGRALRILLLICTVIAVVAFFATNLIISIFPKFILGTHEKAAINPQRRPINYPSSSIKDLLNAMQKIVCHQYTNTASAIQAMIGYTGMLHDIIDKYPQMEPESWTEVWKTYKVARLLAKQNATITDENFPPETNDIPALLAIYENLNSKFAPTNENAMLVIKHMQNTMGSAKQEHVVVEYRYIISCYNSIRDCNSAVITLNLMHSIFIIHCLHPLYISAGPSNKELTFNSISNLRTAQKTEDPQDAELIHSALSLCALYILYSMKLLDVKSLGQDHEIMDLITFLSKAFDATKINKKHIKTLLPSSRIAMECLLKIEVGRDVVITCLQAISSITTIENEVTFCVEFMNKILVECFACLPAIELSQNMRPLTLWVVNTTKQLLQNDVVRCNLSDNNPKLPIREDSRNAIIFIIWAWDSIKACVIDEHHQDREAILQTMPEEFVYLDFDERFKKHHSNEQRYSAISEWLTNTDPNVRMTVERLLQLITEKTSCAKTKKFCTRLLQLDDDQIAAPDSTLRVAGCPQNLGLPSTLNP